MSDGAAGLVGEIERLGSRILTARAEIGRVIFGQETVLEQTLISILAGGHVLLIGVPGLATTRPGATLGVGLRPDYTPGQSPPDLEPPRIRG